MLEPYPNETTLQAAWEQLGVGAPTIIACALLCSKAMHDGPLSDAPLSPEAEAILWKAKDGGVLEIKGTYTAYSGAARLLAVCIEQPDETLFEFRSLRDVEWTVRFLDGFRELCQHGFVLHHLFRDFSLSSSGFARARRVDPARATDLLQQLTSGSAEPLAELDKGLGNAGPEGAPPGS